MVKGAECLYSNEMDAFNARPGMSNQFGVVDGDLNLVKSIKRPLGLMSSTNMVKHIKVALVLIATGRILHISTG